MSPVGLAGVGLVGQDPIRAGPGTATAEAGHPDLGEHPGLAATFARTSWRERSLRGASQASLVNNLNDGLTWGVFPLLFTDHGLGLAAVGLIKGLYPIL
ncbi:hypothetical protein [Nonomuraea sp. NPDC049504]|uniref:hypothetical protein n=1 Tax=Nonomuraea sp. NPDC049504 TaxID=3154729 RepID=UPI00341DE044